VISFIGALTVSVLITAMAPNMQKLFATRDVVKEECNIKDTHVCYRRRIINLKED
jgi:hypothetical protein